MDLLRGRPEGIASKKTWINNSSKDMVKEWLGGECSGSSIVVRIHSLKALNS